jgi:hypothetical protein
LQNITALLRIDRILSNRANKSGPIFFPMKYLARIQGHGQVEVWRFDSRKVHWWIEQSCQSGSDLDAIL